MSNIQAVTVTISEAQAKAIRKLALGNKKSASELADDLFAQVVRGRFKAKKETAAADYGARWDTAAEMLGADKMPMPRKEYVEKGVQELYDILKDL